MMEVATKKIRVGLIDDHAIVIRGLEAGLQCVEDIEIIGSGYSGHHAISLCWEHKPDVLLLDLMMPDLSGLDALPRIRQISPDTAVVILTTFKEHDLIKKALDSGAMSFLLKNVSLDKIIEAIRKAQQGQATLAAEATSALIKMVTQPSSTEFGLTEREVEVLNFLVGGLSNPDIGEKLFISRSTVKNHVSSILKKLDAASRTEAATMAIKQGLIEQN